MPPGGRNISNVRVACHRVNYDNLAHRINKINFNSPDIREDFDLIKISHLGRRLPRPKPHEW